MRQVCWEASQHALGAKDDLWSVFLYCYWGYFGDTVLHNVPLSSPLPVEYYLRMWSHYEGCWCMANLLNEHDFGYIYKDIMNIKPY